MHKIYNTLYFFYFFQYNAKQSHNDATISMSSYYNKKRLKSACFNKNQLKTSKF